MCCCNNMLYRLSVRNKEATAQVSYDCLYFSGKLIGSLMQRPTKEEDELSLVSITPSCLGLEGKLSESRGQHSRRQSEAEAHLL